MNKKGFCLIELMIVVAICGILLSVAIPAYMNYSKSREGNTTISSGSGPSVNEGTVIFNN